MKKQSVIKSQVVTKCVEYSHKQQNQSLSLRREIRESDTFGYGSSLLLAEISSPTYNKDISGLSH
jgi:hypothetical protein